MTEKIYTVLFLCTGNSARSIMAEALLNTLGKGRFRAYSAGSHPTGKVNPFAIEQCHRIGYRTDDLRTKNWNEFAVPDAPSLDFVITVCDKAAGEICPVWPGQPIAAHWGFEDPAAFEGTDEEKRRVFNKVLREISNRINLFLSLPLSSLDRLALEQKVREIGRVGASEHDG